ncbi:type II toxin-antitoxin system prevent-host-death family antitoxin [Bacillota bacterium]
MRASATEVQNNFGKYLAQAMASEEVIVTRNGRSVAKLIAYEDQETEMIKDPLTVYQTDKRVTYEEYLALVEDTEERYELIDGELYYLASPFYKHQAAQAELIALLMNFFKGKNCKALTAPFDVKLFNQAKSFEDDPNVVQPDLLVIFDKEKLTKQGRYEGTPTLVVEILSSSTRRKDLIKKLNLYMNSGVKEYWIVNPEGEEIVVHYFENRDFHTSKTYLAGQTLQSVAFEGLTADLDQVFAQ